MDKLQIDINQIKIDGHRHVCIECNRPYLCTKTMPCLKESPPLCGSCRMYNDNQKEKIKDNTT